MRRTSTRDLEGAPLDQKYLSSLYWALTTLLKTPWVGPDTMLEKAFTSLMIVLGTFVFALLQGTFAEIKSIFDYYAKSGTAGSASATAAMTMQTTELTTLALDCSIATPSFPMARINTNKFVFWIHANGVNGTSIYHPF